MSRPLSVLLLFNLTDTMAAPWLEAGHRVTMVDLQHLEGAHQDGGLTRIGADVSDWWPDEHYDFVFGFPPCTDLAVSGATHFAAKGIERRRAAMALVYRTRDIGENMRHGAWVIENPVSVISSEWRQPDWTFDPWQYGGYLTPPGDRYTKKTCLWAGPAFIMPPKRPVSPWEGQGRIMSLPPSRERANLRSATPEGFARAVFAANEGPCLCRARGELTRLSTTARNGALDL